MDPVARPWISARESARRLGIPIYRLHTMALSGQIRTKVEPGVAPKYNAEDVDRLAADRQPASA